MTDREQRLMRALTRLAVAIECLEEAEPDLAAASEDLAGTVYLRKRSLLWVCRRVNEELWKAEGP